MSNANDYMYEFQKKIKSNRAATDRYIYVSQNFDSFQTQIGELKGSKDINAYQNAFLKLPEYKGYIDDKSYNSLYNGLSENIKQLTAYNDQQNKIKKYKDDMISAVTEAMKNDTVSSADLLTLQQMQLTNHGIVDNDTSLKVQKRLLGFSTGNYATDDIAYLSNIYHNAKNSGDTETENAVSNAYLSKLEKKLALTTDDEVNANYKFSATEQDYNDIMELLRKQIFHLEAEGGKKDEVKTLRTKISVYDKSLKLLERAQKISKKYDNYKLETDYDEVSKKGENIKNPTVNEILQMEADAASPDDYFSVTTVSGDVVKNKLKFYRDYDQDSQNLIFAADVVPGDWRNIIVDGNQYNWNQIKDDEYKMYNYLLASKGEAAADEYLSDLTIILDNRAYTKQMQSINENMEKGSALEKIAYNMGSVFINAWLGFAPAIDNVITFIKGGNYSPWSPAYMMTNSAEEIRSFTSSEIKEAIGGEQGSFSGFLSDCAAIGYQGAMSFLDNIVGYTAYGSKGYTATMGLSAMSSKAAELYEQGVDSVSIATVAAMSGVTAAACEYIPLKRFEDLISGGLKGGLIKNLFSQGGTEAAEEGINQAADFFIDAWILGYGSTTQKQILFYMENENLSREDAERKAFFDNVSNILWAGYGGFIGGAFGGGVAGSINYAQYKSAQNNVYSKIGSQIIEKGSAKNLVATGIQFENGTLAHKLANKMQASDTKNAVKVGKLYDAVMTEAANQEVSKAIENKDVSIALRVAKNNYMRVAFQNITGVQLPLDIYNAIGIATDTILGKSSTTILTNSGNPNAELTDGAHTNVNNSDNKTTNATPQPKTAGEEVVRYLDAQQGKTANEQIVQPTSQATNVDISQQQNNYQAEKGRSVFSEPNLRERSDVTAGDEIVSMMNGEKFAKTNEHRRCERIAEKLGMPVEWYAGAANENGYYQNGTIYLNMNSPEPFMFIFKHEFTHHLESSKWYNEFVSYVEGTELYLNWIANKGGETAYANSIKSDYAKAGKACDVQHEIIANFVGEKLLGGKGGLSIGTDGEVINTDIMVERELYKFAKEKPTIFNSIIDHIRTIIAKLRQYFGKTSGFNSENELNAIYRYLVHMKETANGKANSGDVVFADGGVSYSIDKDNDGNNVVVIDTDQGLFAGVAETEYRKIAKEYLNEHFKNAVLPLSNYGLVSVNKTGIGKYTYSGKRLENSANNAKMKAATELDNLLRTAEYIKSSGDRKNHNFAADGFDYYRTRFIVGGSVFEGIVDIGVSDKGAEFYGMTNIKNVTSRYYGKYSNLLLGYKSVTQSDIKEASLTAQDRRYETSSDTTVPQKEQSVNNYSMQEGEKNTPNKQKQLEIINSNNPAPNEYSTWIRSEKDIKTFAEALSDPEWAEYDEYEPDYTKQMAEKALKNGEIEVYSSYPIKQGVFVSPSKMEAESYSGSGKIYEKTVKLSDVAWIDPTQGQYAKIQNDTKYSLENEKQFSISNNKAKQNNGITAVADHNQAGAFNSGYTELDADGNEMTNEQSSFFSKSKARDENGNLFVVYHGTENGNFNVFDRSRQGSTDSGVWGRGFYFDIDSEIANDYGEYVRPFYLNITNPYIIDEFSESAEKTATYLQSNGYDVDFDYHGMDLLQFIKKFGNQKFSDTLQDLGYDGVIIGNAEFVVYDESQIKLTNNQNPTNDQDIRYSIGTSSNSTQFTDRVNELSAQLAEGAINEGEYRQQLQNMLDEANDKYGTIPKGERPAVDVKLPKQVSDERLTRRNVRTILETGKMNDEMTATVYKDILKDTLSYVPASDKGAMNYAEQQLKSGRALGIWEATVNGTGKINKNAIACGEALLRMEAKAGNTQRVMQLIAELSEVATRAGQTVQAFSLLKKMDGIGQLYYIQKCVDRLNQDLEKKNKNNFEPVTINEEFATELANAKPGQETEAVVDMILDEIADQVPSTFLDKWNAWRYLSMLGNPKTHLRNILGNAVFVPAVKTKDTIKAGIEKVAVPKDQRTSSAIIGKEYKDFAKNDFKEVEDIITGNGKMNPSDAVKERQKVFKNRLLENIRKYNFDMLEKEDSIFLKMHYARALGGFLQARDIDLNNITNEQLNEARNYAILEAQKATYRDACALANTINKASKSNAAANIIIEGVLPFKKTPINIIKRGIEYSPIGALKTLTKGTYDLKREKITASQYIDGLSSGLTGTGLFVVGAILSSLGVAIGGLGYDDDDALKRLNGEQEYSIELFGKSYTVDWMAPACIPFFMGVEFMNMFDDSDKSFAAAFVDAGYGSLEPIINLSMLDGIRDTIAAAKYSDDENVFTSILGEAVKSYAGQALPTIAGQVARTFDSTRRSTYVSSDATGFEKAVQQFLQSSVQGKVPIWENMKQEYTNAFGETDENTNFFARLIQNMVSPGYASSVKETDVTRQLQELYNNTGETGVIPKKAPKSIYIGNGERKYLNADEYTKFNKAKGEYSKQLLSDLFESSAYKRMVYEQKAIAVKEAYAYALALAKSEVSDYELKNPYKSWKEYQDRGINIADLIVLKVTDMDADGSGSVSKEEYAEAVSNTDMSDAEKKLLIGINDNKSKSDYKAKKIGAFKEGKWFKKEGGKYVEITSSKELVELRRNGITTYELTNAKTSAIEEMWRIFEENNK